MKNSKGLKALGLSILAVLGMMAFSAVGAQAQEFLLLNPGKTFAEEKLGGSLTGKIQLGLVMLIVPGRGIIIHCKEAHSIYMLISSQIIEIEIQGLECIVLVLFKGEGTHNYKLGAKSPCHITGLEVKVAAKLKPILHGGETFVLAEPRFAGQPFSSFTFLSGTGCPLPLSTTVSGSIGARVLQSQSNPQSLTMSPAIQLLLGDKLLYGAFESYLEGVATAQITGPESFANAPWGAH